MKMFRVEGSRETMFTRMDQRTFFLTSSLTWPGIQQQGLDHRVRIVVLANNFTRR